MAVTIPEIAISPFLSAMGQYGTMAATPEYQMFTAPLSNKGNPTSRIDKSGNTFSVTSGAPVRLVDNRTKKVVYEGTGYEAAQEAIRIAQDLSNTYGKKASWEIQSTSPGSESWTTLAKEKKNKSILGAIADIALPIAGAFIPGVGPVLGAAIGSGASSVAQGRSLENTLLRAGLAAGGSALGGAVFGKGIPAGATDAAVSANVNNAINAAYQAAQQGAASSLGSVYGGALGGAALGSGTGAALGSGVSAAAGGFPDEIFVTALKNQAPAISAGSALGSVIPSALLPNAPSAVPTTTTPAAKPDKNLLEKITAGMSVTDYLTLASLLGSAAGGLFGGGGGGGGGAGATAGSRPALLPAPVLGGSQAAARQLNAPYSGDYTQYGFGPEYQFFKPA